jgi:PiT family inorganic phosphate transporter
VIADTEPLHLTTRRVDPRPGRCRIILAGCRFLNQGELFVRRADPVGITSTSLHGKRTVETATLIIVVLTIALALFFDFTNGFHDTANAMATPIATGALKPKVAVLLAAALNLVGAFLSTEVAKTISGGIIHEEDISSAILPAVILAGLIGAITWNMLTWLLGLPSSSSHALFGGLIGATIVGVGFTAVNFSVVTSKVILPAVIAPLTAGLIAFAATKLAYVLTRRYDGKPDGRDGFRFGQIFTSSLVALAHGTNDAQKTMGIITLLLITTGLQSSDEPQTWVIIACAVTIALGTYMGGWRIIRTLGKGLTEVKPAQGFAAESSTASTILASSALGFALSTTQVASGSVIGSGLGRRGSQVRWRTVGRIMIGWILTLPAAGAVGALAALVVVWQPFWGVIIDTILAAIVILALYLRSRRDEVNSANAMSEVADSGRAVKVKRNPPPTRRQRAMARDEARRKAAADAAAKRDAQRAAKPSGPGGRSSSGPKNGAQS